MALISLSMFSQPKKRPSAYKASGAAYSVGGNKGFYIASLPRPYPKTPQQKKAGGFAADCGIKSGINKAQLQHGMKCVKFMYAGKSKEEARKEAGVAA